MRRKVGESEAGELSLELAFTSTGGTILMKVVAEKMQRHHGLLDGSSHYLPSAGKNMTFCQRNQYFCD